MNTGVNGKRYGNKSSNVYEITRRAKRNHLSIENLLEKESKEQVLIDQGYSYCKCCSNWKIFRKAKGYCKDCYAKRTLVVYDKEKERAQKLKRNYGLSIEQYNIMRENQNYMCYICNVPENQLDRALAVDHCHTTGIIRGLLCGNCNRFLGQIKDDIKSASRMVEYLMKFNQSINN